VPSHSIDDLPVRVLKRIAKLVEVDARLFLETLKLFEVKANIAEAVTGVQVLCDDAVRKLRRGLEFVMEASEHARREPRVASVPLAYHRHPYLRRDQAL
jgi:hypothetical protein